MESTRLNLMNPWWEAGSRFIDDPFFKNLMASPVYFVNPLLSSLSLSGRPFHIIRGPRQVGKTTFLKLLIRQEIIEKRFDTRNILYLTCESMQNFLELVDTIEPWLAQKPAINKLLILDEVSFVKEWQRAILHLDNLGLLASTSMIVTGSNARDLKQSSEKFPGRRHQGKDINFYPLSPVEMATLPFFKKMPMPEILKVYETIGGFPHAIHSYSINGYVDSEVYETYRNWIVGDAARYRLHEEALKHILYRIYLCCPNRLTWPQLIENTPVKSHETALEYVEHLQDAFICNVVHCYDPANAGPAFHKARKIFFIDPLLYYVAIGWKVGFFDLQREVLRLLDDPKFRGGLFESYTSSILARTGRVFFWYSSKEKKEVDIVRPTNSGIELMDCKLSEAPSYKAMSGQLVRVLTPQNFLDQVDHGTSSKS